MKILDKIKDRRSYETTTPISIAEEANEPEEELISTKEENTTIFYQEEKSNTEKHNQAIQTEIEEMLAYALRKGKEVPEEIANLLCSKELSQLLAVHTQLCKVISPATPETIRFVSSHHQKKAKYMFFSPIPLVRYFIIIAIIAIISLIGSGLSAEVNTITLSKGILNNSGMSLLKNLIFLCSAALIGVVFFLLSKLTKEVKEATLSKDDTTYYWAMLIMGMLSGLILSEVIVLNQASLEEQSIEMNRLLFALLGGFSSEVVYGILQGIMNKLERILK